MVNSFQRHDSKQKPRTRLGLSPATAETATPLTVPGGRPD
jgi:hypothetical protein